MGFKDFFDKIKDNINLISAKFQYFDFWLISAYCPDPDPEFLPPIFQIKLERLLFSGRLYHLDDHSTNPNMFASSIL